MPRGPSSPLGVLKGLPQRLIAVPKSCVKLLYVTLFIHSFVPRRYRKQQFYHPSYVLRVGGKVQVRPPKGTTKSKKEKDMAT